MNSLSELINNYYSVRGLKQPDAWRSLAFAHTEIAEVYELLLDRDGGWIRNNPGDKNKFSKERLEEELGDVLMMIMETGISEGVDPERGLRNKIQRKLEALKNVQSSK